MEILLVINIYWVIIYLLVNNIKIRFLNDSCVENIIL